MKIFNKKLVKIIGIIFGILFVLYLVIIIPEIWKSYQWQKAVDEWQEAQRKPYEEDIHGGKTPEETWSMFLDALKKGDIDLASKYFAVEDQIQAKKWLEELKKNNEIEQTIKEMDGLKKSTREALDNQSNHYYDYFDKEFNQVLSSTVIFYLNPSTKVWKILF